MAKFNDTQLVILAAAAKREDGSILPLLKRLKLDEDALNRVLESLVRKKLAVEVPASRETAVWRNGKDGGRTMLAISKTALRAIGIEPDGDGNALKVADKKNKQRPSKELTPTQPTERPAARKEPGKIDSRPSEPRLDSKQAQLIDLLRRSKGATIEQMMEAMGWQAHSVRGVMSGALKKKLGLKIVSEKTDDRGRVYRIAGRG